MKINVDRGACDLHGLCVMSSPEVFAFNDDDELEILLEDVPDRRLPDVEAAVRACPKQALFLTDD